jgi:hypothetical protein
MLPQPRTSRMLKRAIALDSAASQGYFPPPY